MAEARNWRAREQGRARREEILEALSRFIDENGYSPTRAELAQMLGVSESTVKRQVEILIEEGLVESGEGPRTIRPAI